MNVNVCPFVDTQPLELNDGSSITISPGLELALVHPSVGSPLFSPPVRLGIQRPIRGHCGRGFRRGPMFPAPGSARGRVPRAVPPSTAAVACMGLLLCFPVVDPTRHALKISYFFPPRKNRSAFRALRQLASGVLSERRWIDVYQACSRRCFLSNLFCLYSCSFNMRIRL